MKKGNAYMFVCRKDHKIRAIYEGIVRPSQGATFIKVNTLTYDNRVEDEAEFINPQQVIRVYPIPYEK